METSQQIKLGDRIGPYLIQEQLGAGGMAIIYKVWHTGLHRFEALKLPRPELLTPSDSAFVQRLLSEARIAARLQHPHIVTIFSISEENTHQPFLAMELVEGCDLGKLLEQHGPLPTEDLISILQQVAAALDYAHANGVIHRDVKPGNILLRETAPLSNSQRPERRRTPRFQVKVVDFGISRALEETGNTKLTKNGILIGTPQYMSPEQSGSGKKVDYHTDIYSLGVLVYEMLCGKPPFVAGEGVNPISVVVKHLHEPPRPPIEHVPGLPRAANDAILKALAKDPAERFASCDEFITALADALPSDANYSAALPLPLPAEVTRQSVTQRLHAVGGTLHQKRQLAAETLLLAGENGVRSKVARSSSWLAGITGLLAGGWLIHTLNNPLPASNALQTPVAPLVSPATKPVPRNQPQAAIAPTASQRRLVQKRELRSIAFPRQTTRTSYLPAGQQRIARKGQTGQREVVLGITYEGEKELARRVLSSRVVKTPIAQIEQIGTKKQAAPVRSRAVATRKPAYRTVSAPKRRVAAPRVTKAPRKSPSGRRSGNGDAVNALVSDLISGALRRNRDVFSDNRGGKEGKRGKHRRDDD